jgi:hypothetical protein
MHLHHHHQEEAIRVAQNGASYVLTTGTGLGTSLTTIDGPTVAAPGPIQSRLLNGDPSDERLPSAAFSTSASKSSGPARSAAKTWRLASFGPTAGIGVWVVNSVL